MPAARRDERSRPSFFLATFRIWFLRVHFDRRNRYDRLFLTQAAGMWRVSFALPRDRNVSLGEATYRFERRRFLISC